MSDSALTQAIRTIRRALGDDPREPQFIRTVSRHGYRFVCADRWRRRRATGGRLPPAPPAPVLWSDPRTALERSRPPAGVRSADDGRAAAATRPRRSTRSGTAAALARLDGRPGHERARAYLRDARWDVPGAAAVPLFGAPGAARTLADPVRPAPAAGPPRSPASAGSTAAFGGAAGRAARRACSAAPCCGSGRARARRRRCRSCSACWACAVGGAGAAGVGAGLAAAEVLVRSWRRLSLAVLRRAGRRARGRPRAPRRACGPCRGCSAATCRPIGGGFEGLVVGGAVGLGLRARHAAAARAAWRRRPGRDAAAGRAR